MIILDTDHLTVLKYARDSRFMKLAERMADSVDQDFATTAIALEEQFEGLAGGDQPVIRPRETDPSLLRTNWSD